MITNQQIFKLGYSTLINPNIVIKFKTQASFNPIIDILFLRYILFNFVVSSDQNIVIMCQSVYDDLDWRQTDLTHRISSKARLKYWKRENQI